MEQYVNEILLSIIIILTGYNANAIAGLKNSIRELFNYDRETSQKVAKLEQRLDDFEKRLN